MEHKNAVGKIVELTPSYSRAAAIGKYVIRQTMPAPENNSDSPRYRIKSDAEKHDRIVSENEIALPNRELPKTRPAFANIQLPATDN